MKVSMRTYSKMRRCAWQSVREAIKSHRLTTSVIVRIKAGKTYYEIDPRVADIEWPRGTKEMAQEVYRAQAPRKVLADQPVATDDLVEPEIELDDEPEPASTTGPELAVEPEPADEAEPGTEPELDIEPVAQRKRAPRRRTRSAPQEVPRYLERTSSEIKTTQTFTQSRALREAYLARIVKLNYEERSAKLIDAEEVKRDWLHICSMIRTKILGLPFKFRQRMPHMSDADYILIESLVREALEDLSDDQAQSTTNAS